MAETVLKADPVTVISLTMRIFVPLSPSTPQVGVCGDMIIAELE